MCMFKPFNNKYFVIISVSVIIAINIIHAALGFSIKVTKFNSYELFDSSPLFDFELSNYCDEKSSLTFHRWGGRTKEKWTLDDNLIPTKKTEIYDQTDIKKINGNNFCYKQKSYKDLLYNGQIIKKGAECPSEYKTNCGRIDTLEQELCIKETEKCPLYDIRLVDPSDPDNYYAKDNIYYSKESFNKVNKKIIGRLTLNDGQPCYNMTEKLWKRFHSQEGFLSHLKCEYEVFGKMSDERYEDKGAITYKKLYLDNLNGECVNMVLNSPLSNEEVHLYQREFLGIDKSCDEKYHLNEDTFSGLKIGERIEFFLSGIGGIIAACIALSYFFLEIVRFCYKEDDDDILYPKGHCIYFSIFMSYLICCSICHIIAFFLVTKYDITGYDCSDPITNEIIRKENVNSAQNIIYIKVHFYLDLVLLGISCFFLIIGFLFEKLGICSSTKFEIIEKLEVEIEKDINKDKEQNVAEIPLNTHYPDPS